jgi:hypothetical protein
MAYSVYGLGGWLTNNVTTSRGGMPFNAGDSSSNYVNGQPSDASSFHIGIAGTMSKLLLYVTTGSSSGNTTYLTYKNGTQVNLTITVPTNATGLFSDITNSDTFAVGDRFEIGGKLSAGSVATVVRSVALKYEPSSGNAFAYNWAAPGSAASTNFMPLSGNLNGTATEANNRSLMRAAGTLRRMSVYVQNNTSTTTTTFRTRKNGANGSQVITFAASTTGRFTDTTNTDTVASGDIFNYTHTGSNATPGVGASMSFTVSGTTWDLVNSYPSTTRGASATPTYISMDKGTSTTEANKRMYFPPGEGVKITRPRVYLSANTYAATATIQGQINGSAGSTLISITNGVTGWFEDTTNADNVPGDNYFSMAIVGGTSGSITIEAFVATCQLFTPAGRNQAMVYG